MASTDAPAPTTAVDETPVSTENQTEQTENVMPASSIQAANQALNSALEAANITKDDDDESSKAASDGQVKTVFHDNASFNVKVRLFAHVPPFERPVNRGANACSGPFSFSSFPAPLVLALDPLVRVAPNQEPAQTRPCREFAFLFAGGTSSFGEVRP
jgi:hypothetical protein